jgi:threonyl-tRNA synthetase
LAVGHREIEEETVAIRRLGSKNQNILGLEDAINTLQEEIKSRQ